MKFMKLFLGVTAIVLAITLPVMAQEALPKPCQPQEHELGSSPKGKLIWLSPLVHGGNIKIHWLTKRELKFTLYSQEQFDIPRRHLNGFYEVDFILEEGEFATVTFSGGDRYTLWWKFRPASRYAVLVVEEPEHQCKAKSK